MESIEGAKEQLTASENTLSQDFITNLPKYRLSDQDPVTLKQSCSADYYKEKGLMDPEDDDDSEDDDSTAFVQVQSRTARCRAARPC